MSAEAPALRVPGEHLLGRHREREVLDRLLQAARHGKGGVLVRKAFRKLDVNSRTQLARRLL